MIDLTTSSATLRWFSPDHRLMQAQRSSQGRYRADIHADMSMDGSSDRSLYAGTDGIQQAQRWGTDTGPGGVQSAPLTYIVRYQLAGTNEVMVSIATLLV